MVRAESDFNARAYSNKGACGLMQLMPATGRRFGVAWDDLFDARKNLAAGTKYLKWLVDRFKGDLPGVGGVQRRRGSVDRYWACRRIAKPAITYGASTPHLG